MIKICLFFSKRFRTGSGSQHATGEQQVKVVGFMRAKPGGSKITAKWEGQLGRRATG